MFLGFNITFVYFDGVVCVFLCLSELDATLFILFVFARFVHVVCWCSFTVCPPFVCISSSFYLCAVIFAMLSDQTSGFVEFDHS